jgi:hypothetical protein
MKEPRKSVRPCWPENISHGQTPGSCSLLWASLHPVTLCPLKPDSHFGEVIWTPRRNSYRLNFPLSGHVQLLLSPWFTWELCGMVFFFFCTGVDVFMVVMEVMMIFESCCTCFSETRVYSIIEYITTISWLSSFQAYFLGEKQVQYRGHLLWNG